VRKQLGVMLFIGHDDVHKFEACHRARDDWTIDAHDSASLPKSCRQV
jgi:hypothetical protein